MASANIEPTQFEVVQGGNSQLGRSKHITMSQKGGLDVKHNQSKSNIFFTI